MKVVKIVMAGARILDDDDILSIDERFSLVPRKTAHKRWIWLKKYYRVCRPNDILTYSEEEYLMEKLKGLAVTI